MPAEIEIVENGQNAQPETKDTERPAENNATPGENNGTAVENNATLGENNGTAAENNATPDENNGTPAENNGTPVEDNESPVENNETPAPLENTEVIIIEPVAEPEETAPEPEEVIKNEEIVERTTQTEEVPDVVPSPPVAAQNGSGGHKKVSMFTSLDTDAVKAAYEDVRSDNSDTQWAVFKFEGSRIVCSAKGSDFDKFREHFTDNDRGFGYIRIQTGDEMSKRQKFLFITWVGPSVSVLQRAKMSTDKSVMKNIISNFAVELQLENDSEFDLKHFKQELNKAGGANYGTGIREN